MLGITLLRHVDRPARPWKNGGGVMWDIAVSPAGADMEAFDWRVSLARIEESRGFSAFPGIDRQFALMEGKGVRLAIAGQPEILAEDDYQCHAFPGEADVAATLVDGPVLALNVMTKRGRYAALVTYGQHGTAATIELSPEVASYKLPCVLVVSSGTLRYGRLGNTILQPNDALLWDSSMPIEIKPLGMISYRMITIEPARRPVTQRSA